MRMNFFDGYIEKFKPQAVSLGEKCAAYADRMIALLSIIAENTSIDDPDRYERRFSFPSLTAADLRDIATVPTGETWIFRYVSIADTGDSTVNILADGVSVFATNRPNSVPLGFRVRGGTTISIDSGAGGAAGVFLMFELERKKPSLTGNVGGRPEHRPDDLDWRQEAELSGRHSTPGVFQGNNAIGERAVSLNGH